MDGLLWVGAVLGFFAFCTSSSLEKRVKKLERQFRGDETVQEAEDLSGLREQLQRMIGEKVKLSFYDEEGDIDLLAYDTKNGFVQIVDVDEKWVLIHAEDKNKKQDKIFRISSIRSVEVKKSEI